MVRYKHQQTTDNTKPRTQNSNLVHNRHKHTTSTRRSGPGCRLDMGIPSAGVRRDGCWTPPPIMVGPTTTTTKPMDFHQLQESLLYTIHGRHRVRFRSDHHTHQQTHCQHTFYKHHTDADTHNIPNNIVCKITQRNNIRRANTGDTALKLLNGKITSAIQQHKQHPWKEHLDAHWDHMHNTHILWKTIHGLSNRAPPPTLNTSITFNNKRTTTDKHIANCFSKQFTNTVKHATHKTNRSINRATHKIQGYNIILTTTRVQDALNKVKIKTH